MTSRPSRLGRNEHSTAELPKEVVTACCTNDINVIENWIASECSIDACSGLADLLQGAAVEARFHGGDEFYEASVKTVNGDGTYSLEYKEHGLIWGEYETCPRDHIRIAGSTVGGETALILAAENNSVDVLSTLLRAGATVDLSRTNGDTALIAASSHDFVDCVKQLLAQGAKADKRNCIGDTAYIVAAMNGAYRSLGVLLEVPSAVRYAEMINMSGVCAVEAAARGNHLKCLDNLLKIGVSPDTRNKDGDSAIMVTARFDTHLECSKRLLASGCNLEFANSVNGDDALKLAARFGNSKLVLLLAEGDMAPPSRVLPDHRNANGDTALMLAVANGSVEAVRSLTHMPGAPLDAKNAQGDSALTWAVWYGHGLLVKELLSAGASPNLATAKGETALMFAAYRNHEEIMKCLIDCKADTKVPNANGDTALALASGCGNAPKCVELLLAAGVDPNIRDGQGHTPLMLAVGQGNQECAIALLKTGKVNVGLRTLDGASLNDFIEGRPDADVWHKLVARHTTVNIPERAESIQYQPTVHETVPDEMQAVKAFDTAMSINTDQSLLVVEDSINMLEHYDEASGKWVMMDASTGEIIPSADASQVDHGDMRDNDSQKNSTSLDADFALALALEQEQETTSRSVKTTRGRGPPVPLNKSRQPRPIRGELVAVNLARLPDGKNFGITITQSPSEGVRILALVHKHDVLEAGDRIIEVNGCPVTGLSVREVAECVRKRRQEKILSLVVEKPRRWGIGRLFSRSEQRSEESLQRYIFGGSYPRTLHLTVIGAIGLPPLYPLTSYPNSYVEVTNRSTATSFRTKVVRNNAFPVWEELIEVVVRSPEDQVVVQLLSEQLDPISNEADAVHRGASDGCRKLSQRLRLPHYDKRFCCNREVSLALSPFSQSPMLAAIPSQSSRPLMLRVKALWEDSVSDRKMKVKQQKRAERRVEKRNSRRSFNDSVAGGRGPANDSASGFHETMHIEITGILGLPPFLRENLKVLGETYIQLRNTATDQTLRTKSLLEALANDKKAELLELDSPTGENLILHDFFVVTMRSAKDKLELVLLCNENDSDTKGELSGPRVIGFATLPHYDERIMLGNEVGLRVRLVDSVASELPARVSKGCVLKLSATWSDKADNPSYPKCLIVNIIGFSMLEPPEGTSPNLHIQVANCSTGQVNRTRTQRDTSFPVFEEVFHVRVKSARDSVVLSVLNRGDGHQSDDIFVGSVELILNEKVLNNREAALEVTSINTSGSHPERKVVGIIQVAAMWESMSMS